MQNYSAVTGLAVFFLFTGCSVFTPTLDEAGIVEIEINQGEKPPDTSFVSAYRSSDKTVIRGQLKYPVWTWFKTFPGHVDVTVEPPGDKKITIHDVAVIRKRLPKKRGRKAYFVTRVASDAPRGTRIAVEYSDKKHEIPMEQRSR